MKALRLPQVHDLGLAEVPVPEPGPRRGAGPDRGGRHLRHRPPSLQGRVPLHAAGDARPRVLPASSCAAAPASTIPEGARVVCDPNDWCGRCDACLRGRVNLCERNVATGIHRDGGFAEYARFPARKAIAAAGRPRPAATAPSASRSPARCTASTSARRGPASACWSSAAA